MELNLYKNMSLGDFMREVAKGMGEPMAPDYTTQVDQVTLRLSQIAENIDEFKKMFDNTMGTNHIASIADDLSGMATDIGTMVTKVSEAADKLLKSEILSILQEKNSELTVANTVMKQRLDKMEAFANLCVTDPDAAIKMAEAEAKLAEADGA